MIGLGTLINVAGILLGGVMGSLCGGLLRPRHQQTLQTACAVSVLFIGIGGAMEGLLSVTEGGIVSGGGMMVVLSLTIGGLIGELLNIEGNLERFGEWLKIKTDNPEDGFFVEAFVTASLTVCIGAMAIVGAIEDGLFGDISILTTKAILDFIIIIVMTGSLGKGCVFSAIPVAVLQGGVTLLARWLQPLLTDAAMANLSTVGSVLIFCVGLNLLIGKKVPVANLLPAVVLAAAYAFLPFSL